MRRRAKRRSWSPERVIALASGWQPVESQLALSSKFVPLLYSIMEFSGALKARALAFTVGDTVDLGTAVNGG